MGTRTQLLPISEPQSTTFTAAGLHGEDAISSPYMDVPVVVHANEQKALKSEDVIFVQRVEFAPGNCHCVFLVCDGHQGADAASFTVQLLPEMLKRSLPQTLPDFSDREAVEAYAERIRAAVSLAAATCDAEWAARSVHSGTTMTLAVVSGWLLTIANTGDSNAVLDTGSQVVEVTCSHRIQANKLEQNRLRQSGAQLAPLGFHLQGPAKPQEMGVGPLRLWPGGLCVSRSIGDLDAGALVIPLPHCRQLLLPRSRALRLIMASDGLWDLVSFDKAAKASRHRLPHQAVAHLIKTVVADRRMADDVSIIIVDMLPNASTTFAASTLKSGGEQPKPKPRSSGGGGGGGLFSCFKAPPPPLDDLPLPSLTTASLSGSPLVLDYVADVDCLDLYPGHVDQAHEAAGRAPPAAPQPTARGDYTVHGGRAQVFRQDQSWHTGTSLRGGSVFSAGQQSAQQLADQLHAAHQVLPSVSALSSSAPPPPSPQAGPSQPSAAPPGAGFARSASAEFEHERDLGMAALLPAVGSAPHGARAALEDDALSGMVQSALLDGVAAPPREPHTARA